MITSAANSSAGTGGIEKFSSKENFRKILKVSHFYLGFSWNENYNNIKHSHEVSSEFSGSYRSSLEFPRSGSKESNETLGGYLISLLFLFGKNPKGKWLTFKIPLKFSLAENFSMLSVWLQLSHKLKPILSHFKPVVTSQHSASSAV